ncbi:MAG: efflux RND transporter periplasmic adaptor subunit [Planctomycetota bacterium]
MKTVVIVLLILLVIGGAAAGGAYLLKTYATPAPLTFKTAKIDTGDIDIVATATGSVEPTSSVKVGSQVSGRVKEVRVEQDQSVKVGQILAVLDTELLENDSKDKEILLRQSKSNLALLDIEKAQLDLKEQRIKHNVERERITRDRAQASFELASKTFSRYQEMVKQNAATESDLDNRRLEKDNARRDVELRAVELSLLEADLVEIGISRRNLAARVEQTELAVEQADQGLKRARTNLGYAMIVSPIDGVVMEKTVDSGQTIAAQFQTPDLFKIAADLKHVLITASIDEIDVGKIKAGQKVSFEVDAFRGEKFSGTVKTLHLKHESKANLVSYPVVIEADNPPTNEFALGKLRPGMTAFLEFAIDNKKGVARVPAAALRFTPPPTVVLQNKLQQKAVADGDAANNKDASVAKKLPGTAVTVYKKDAKGQPVPVHIRVGESNGKFYELLSTDLKSGDEVITGQADAAPASGAQVVEIE